MAEPRVPRLERPFFAADSREFWVRIRKSYLFVEIESEMSADTLSDVPIKADHRIDGTAVANTPFTSAQIALMRLCFIVHQ
jgi:hypothetical protein